MLWIYLALIVLVIALTVRHHWVFNRMTKLNRFEGSVHVIREYADYMMWRFWVWDIDKFKTPNVQLDGRAPVTTENEMTFEEWYGVGWDTTVAADARDAWEAATLAACEACAKFCDDLYEPGDFWGDGKAFGNAIRERFNVEVQGASR